MPFSSRRWPWPCSAAARAQPTARAPTSSAIERSRRDPRAGFTLIETLVAVAVVAAVSVALQRGFLSTRQALARAEAVTAAGAVARDILDNRLGELVAGVGVRSGETSDGLVWTVTSEPLDLPFPPPPPPSPPPEPTKPAAAGSAQAAPAQAGEGAEDDEKPFEPKALWAPLRVTIRVEAVSGPPFIVETVRLAVTP